MTKFVDYNYHDVRNLVDSIITQMKLQEWKPDYVIGLTRGGLTPAVMISHDLGVKFLTLNVSFRDGEFGPESSFIPELTVQHNAKLLVVDDINDTGNTFAWIRSDWLKSFFRSYSDLPKDLIKFATLIHNDPSSSPSDYIGKRINKDLDPHWVRFFWESWREIK